MKKIVYLISAITLFFSCNKEEKPIDNSPIELSPYIIENYYNDAKQLYMDEIISDSSHPNYTNSILDTTEIDKILKII